MRQVPLPLVPQPPASFETFEEGDNALLVAQLRAEIPPRSPLYLWGPSGCGKTHLLQALALACRQQGWGVTRLDTGSPALGQPGNLVSLDAGAGLLVLDDVHLLPAPAQREAFALLVEAQSQGLPWAAAGPVPPVDLPLRDDLRSRLGWGHVHAVQALSEAQTRAVLRREADRRGVALGDEVLDYLLSRFARDLGHLMPLLDRLDEYALAHARALTVPLLRQMLAESPVCPDQEIQPSLELDS